MFELRDDDRNTKYFHHKVSQRKQQNHIKGVYDDDGVWQEDEEIVKERLKNILKYIFLLQPNG